MKHVCTTCERVWPETQLWCKTRTCGAGTLSIVFDYGEYLSDILIVKMVRVLRTATIYEAQRGKEKILLKVAHDDCQEMLKREATTLSQLAQTQQHPMLPVLLPAYPGTVGEQRPYGKTVYRGQTKYYVCYQFVEGEFLRDMLIKNPQPWYQHAAWLVTSIADAVAFMHIKAAKLHLNLSPDTIMVRLDKDGLPRPVLLDIGVASEPQLVDAEWSEHHAHPAYVPPELLSHNAPDVRSDVYGLGLALYEMLNGNSAFRYKMRSEDDVRSEVRSTAPPPLNRTDLAPEVLQIVQQAIEYNPANRYADVRTFAKALRTKFGEVPAERKGRRIDRRVFAVGIFFILIFVIVVVIAALLPLVG